MMMLRVCDAWTRSRGQGVYKRASEVNIYGKLFSAVG